MIRAEKRVSFEDTIRKAKRVLASDPGTLFHDFFAAKARKVTVSTAKIIGARAVQNAGMLFFGVMYDAMINQAAGYAIDSAKNGWEKLLDQRVKQKQVFPTSVTTVATEEDIALLSGRPAAEHIQAILGKPGLGLQELRQLNRLSQGANGTALAGEEAR